MSIQAVVILGLIIVVLLVIIVAIWSVTYKPKSIMTEKRDKEIKRFFKIVVPIVIGIVVFLTSLFFYVDAGQHLTPASVSVRGYYRQDGTYVRPYNRRPPGGVQHDAPYENTRSFTMLLMVGSGVGSGVYVYYLVEDNKKRKYYKRLSQGR